MSSAGVSVIIPALNEAGAIGQVVRSLPWELISECIVVDNGSSDETAAEAAKAGARVISSPRGYGYACSAGAAAAAPGSGVLVFMDGDGADVPSEMSALLSPVQSGTADFVIGSRLRGVREAGSMLPSQVFAAHLVGWLLLRTQGVSYTDMGAFRAIRRDKLEAMRMEEMTFGWNLEMQIKAAQQGLRIQEIPVSYRRRLAGESKVAGNFQASVRAAWRILGVLLRVGLRRRTPPTTAAP